MLKGKVALITGGGRGIGRAIVLKMASEGADIAMTYLSNKESADEVVRLVEGMGRRILCMNSNASDFAEAEMVVNETVKVFGQIDILVNNAGMNKDTLIMKMEEDQWDSVITANLKSAFNYSKLVSRLMIRRRSGSIINMSSVVGLAGNAGQSNYSASKSGLIGLTKSLSKELASRNIRVNVIAPGFIQTDMTDNLSPEIKQIYINDIAMRRMGTADEVANVALFLASDLASYISGEVLNVSGHMKG